MAQTGPVLQPSSEAPGRPVVPARAHWRVALALFVFAFCLLQWQNGERFQLSLDEGIYLDGASRVAAGQAPYRDFFTFTGPGTYWLYGAVFSLFGVTLGNAHFLLSLEIALLAALVYWIAARITEWWFAACLGATFAAFCLDLPTNLYVSHRWDSNLAALSAAAFACAGLNASRRVFWIASGVCAAAAAWITPPFIVVGAVMAAWMAWTGGVRRVRDFTVGVAAPSLAAIGVLAYQGALGPMIDQLLWAMAHYSAPNRVPYGYFSENPVAGIRSAWIVQAILQAGRLVEFCTPAALPLVAYGGLAVLFVRSRYALKQQRDLIALLAMFSAGVLVAGMPRLGAHQLVFVSPVFWILCGYVVFVAAGQRRRWLPVLLGALSLLMLVSSTMNSQRYSEAVETSAGTVRCTPEDARLLSALGNRINPGDSLFVFPYLPIAYFLFGGQDPSRYSFLQPGMMTAEDEARVESELRAHPPKWMLWARFPDAFWRSAWPNTHAASLSFPALERYMASNYREVLRVEMTGQQTLILGCAGDCGTR